MDVICVIGHFGRYQAVLLLLVFVVTFPVTFTFFSTPFFDRQMDRWCMRHRFQNSAWTFGELGADTSNLSNSEVFKCFGDALKMLENNGSINATSGPEMSSCVRSQNWDPLVSQAVAICEDLWEESTLQVVLLVAVSFGFFGFGAASDTFGRRRCLLVALFLSSVSSLVAATAPVSWFFLTSRFLACMATAGLLLVSIILYSEAVGRKHRALLMFALGAGLAVANISLQTLTQFISNWWYLQLSSGIIVLVALPLAFYAQESPRWLVATGRVSTAEDVLLDILKVNHGPQLYMEVIMLELMDKLGTDFSAPQRKQPDRCASPSRRLHVLIIFISAAAALVLQQSAPVTASVLGPRMTAELWGIDVSLWSQVLISILFYWMAVRFKRRYSLSCLFTLLAVAYICSFFLPQDAKPISVALYSSVQSFASYQAVFLWLTATELFATTSRGFGLGCCWTSAHLCRLGAPVISMMKVFELQPATTCVILTTVALVCSALVLFLPVTHSHILPDTYQELRQFQRKASLLAEDEVKSPPKKLLYAT